MVAKTRIYKKPENASCFLNKEEKIVSYQAPSRSYVSNTPCRGLNIWRLLFEGFTAHAEVPIN